MYTLYSFPVSQHARRVIALLEAANLDYTLRHVALDKGEHMGADYRAINPNHKVPTLIDGDLSLYESNAILRYLANIHGLDDWYPVDPKARATVDMWLDWNQTRLGQPTVDVVLNEVFLGDNGDAAAIARGDAALVEVLAVLEGALEDRNYLAGDAPTIADLSVASNVTHLAFAKRKPAGPNSAGWLQRVCAIDGFARTLPEAGR